MPKKSSIADTSGSSRRTKWVLRGVSVFVAFVLWVFVAWDFSTDSRTASFMLPLSYLDTPEGYSLSDTIREVEVRFDAAPEQLSMLGRGDITASVSLQDLRPGKYRLPVRVDSPSGVTVISCAPSFVEFELFRTIERTMAPLLNIPDDEAGDEDDLTDIVFDPPEVVVKGKESDVLAVAHISASAAMSDFVDPEAWRDVSPSPLRADGSEVQGVVISPDKLRVRARKKEPQAEISVPVRVPIRGAPDGGREVGSVMISPESVTLVGTKSALSNITELVLDPLDITGNTEDIVIDIPLDAPGDGITISGTSSVRVRVEIHSPVDTMTFVGVPITVEGEGAFREWTVTPATASVTVERLISSTEPFDSQSPPCTLYVDVTHVVSERLMLPLLLKDLPSGMKVVRVEPQQVVVTGADKKEAQRR